MKTLADIKGGCRIDEGGHWIWAGARSAMGAPRIYGVDLTIDPAGNTYKVQHGKRAVWHLKTGQPIKPLHRVYSRCRVPGCVRPSCLICETESQYGARLRATGVLRGSLTRRLINHRNNLRNRAISDEQLSEIRAGGQTDAELAVKFGVHRGTVSRYRRGLIRSAANHFQVLMS